MSHFEKIMNLFEPQTKYVIRCTVTKQNKILSPTKFN